MGKENKRITNPDIEAKLSEFRIWAMTLGRYSPSTVQRAIRRVRSFSPIIDLMHPDQSAILNFFASEIQNGTKAHTINNQRKDIAAWFRFLGIEMEMPKIREPPTPDPWIPSDEEAKIIINASGRMSTRKEVNLRNSIITKIAFMGGARIGEIVQHPIISFLN